MMLYLIYETVLYWDASPTDCKLYAFDVLLFLLQVGHAVQGWILDPRLNLGLEVLGGVEVGRATLQINTKVRK